MWCFGGGLECLLENHNFLFVSVNLYKCYLKMPMVSKSFFFEIHCLRFLVGIGYMPPYREMYPIPTTVVIYVFSNFGMPLIL